MPRTQTSGSPKAEKPRAAGQAPQAPTRAGQSRGRVPGGPAKYTQVAEALREQIASGALPPASALPSETQLMETYGVSRPTARAAVAALRAEGLITVLHGKGAFVRAASLRPGSTHPRGITAETSTVRRRTVTRYTDSDADSSRWHPAEEPSQYRTEATAELALLLGISERAPLFVAERLLADPAGRRMSVRTYVPFAVAADVPALEDDPFRAPGDLYTVLAAAGRALDWTENVTARMPSPDDSASLRIPPGTPMLVTRRLTRDGTGRALALEETRLSAEDAQLSYRLTSADT